MEIMVYEQAEEIVRAQKNIVVAPCICRQEQQMIGGGCGKPLETCLSFGSAAAFYQRNGLGRPIDKEEALHILELARTTFIPSWAQRRARPRPMPLAAPVITATLSLNSFIFHLP